MRLLLLLLLFPLLSVGQNSFRASIGAKAGMGWWIYNLGHNADTAFIGYKRSHASPAIGYTVDLSYAVKKFSFGVHGTYGQFIDRKLFDSRYTIFNKLADTVSGTKIVSTYQPGVSLEYFIVKSEKFEWAPHLEFGYLGIKTTHPDKANFGFQGYVNIGFMHRWWLGEHWGISFLPIYNRAFILPKNGNAGERHDLFSFTAGFGLHYRVITKRKEEYVE